MAKLATAYEGPIIVGVVASAGGLEAFKTFFQAMPADSGFGFVLVQHLDPTHESLMVELLSRYTTMPVVQAEAGQRIAPNRVYMIPPNRYLTITDGKLRLSEPSEPRGARMVIDRFLRSLAEDQQERAIAIVLSGSGSDGTVGLQAIKAHGGLTLAQDPVTAAHDGMPRSAIAAGVVEQVLPIPQMPEALLRYVRHPRVGDVIDATVIIPQEDKLSGVLTVLLTRKGMDFRGYKPNTVARRIDRRMRLLQAPTLDDYLQILRDQPEEVERLSSDLLIGVTGFFRDVDAFAALEEQVISPLVAKARADRQLRVWVPGCATGEEVYSIVILLWEQMTRQKKLLPVQMFASDIDEMALKTAREGIYSAAIVADIPETRLRRYFVTVQDNLYQIRKELREAVIFARQNVIGDPPFSRLDLISCRNLLIYLQPKLQNRVFGLFHFALNPSGYLLLGSAESIGRHTGLFRVLDKRYQIYQKIEAPRQVWALADGNPRTKVTQPVGVAGQSPQERQDRLDISAPLWLLSAFGPAAVVINEHFDVLYRSGNLKVYLRASSGSQDGGLLDVLHPALVEPAGKAVERVLLHESAVVEAAEIERSSETFLVLVRVKPIPEQNGLLMVAFTDAPSKQPAVAGDAKKEVHRLQTQLRATRQDLQGSIEESETANEELRASNEEVMSANEELQSTNEELESSKEELQSLNEELNTVNSQLQDKVVELEQVNDDMNNLLTSSEVATLFLDVRCCIKRYTPALTRLVNLIPSDVDRPLRDIALIEVDSGLLADCQQVLESLKPCETELQVRSKRWYMRRVLPYRTQAHGVAGVVVTYTEITALKQTEQALRERETQFRQAIVNAPFPVLLHVEDGEILAMSGIVTELTGFAPEEIPTMEAWLEKVYPNASREALRFKLRALYALTERQHQGEVEIVTKSGEHRLWDFSSTPLGVDQAGRRLVVSMAVDVSERRQAEQALRHSEQRYVIAVAASRAGIYEHAVPFDASLYYSPRWAEIIGYDVEELPPYDRFLDWLYQRTHSEDLNVLKQAYEDFIVGRTEHYEIEIRLRDHQGRWVWVRDYAQAMVRNDTGQATRIVGLMFDISDHKHTEQVRQESEQRFRDFAELAADVFWETDEQLRFVYISERFATLTGIPAGEVLGVARDTFIAEHAAARPLLAAQNQWHRQTLQTRRAFKDMEWAVTDSNGMTRMFCSSGKPIHAVDGRFLGYRGVEVDTTEYRQVAHQATHDDLTGLPNRTLLHELCQEALSRAARGGNRAALLFIDLDQFKTINDGLGHDVGDAFLQAIAWRLSQTARSGVSTVTRFGGDEFIVLLDTVDSVAAVTVVAQRILENVVQPVELAGQTLQTTASIGISLFPDDGDSYDALLKSADTAMYRAKHDGGDCYRFFESAMNIEALRSLMLKGQMRQALSSNQFELVYQPIKHLDRDRLTGCEALLRWRHPELGVISPAEFIPVAEETGAIVAIGAWVIESVCRQAAVWRQQGLPALCLAVNVAPRQLHQDDFVERIAAALAAHELNGEALQLEITESTLMQDLELIGGQLQRLKKLGVRIAIDDFGTGYSSLSYLKRLPIDCLKIDREFIKDIPWDEDDIAITQAIIAMAKKLRMTLIAEGVETEAQLNFLKAEECDEAQGFLLGKPQSAAALQEILEQSR